MPSKEIYCCEFGVGLVEGREVCRSGCYGRRMAEGTAGHRLVTRPGRL